MRFLTWFSPCAWGDIDGYGGIRGFYHGTPVGRAIVNSFWKVLGGDVISLNGYDSHPKTAKLKPWTSAMFTGSSFSIMNYDTNFMDIVKSDLVNVYVSEIDHLSQERSTYPTAASSSPTLYSRTPAGSTCRPSSSYPRASRVNLVFRIARTPTHQLMTSPTTLS